MKAERLALYGASFPKGFAAISKCEIYDAIKVKANGRSKYLPSAAKRDPKPGEIRVKITYDIAGHGYEKGDILLSKRIGAIADWIILGIGPQVVVRNDFQHCRYQYAVVRQATEAESADPKSLSTAHTKKVMDWGMNS